MKSVKWHAVYVPDLLDESQVPYYFFLFFFTEHAVSLWNFCGPVTEILVPTLTLIHDGRGTSTNVHPYLRDARSSSFTASKHNLFYFTGDLVSFWTTSVIASVHCCLLHTTAVTTMAQQWQSLTTGLCPGTQQLAYFRRLSTNSLVALNSVCVVVSKIRPFLRANEVLHWSFFFPTLDGFLKICSCQNSPFQKLCICLLTFIGSYFFEIFSDNWRLLCQQQSSLVKFSIFCFFFLLPVYSFQSVVQ